MDFVFTTRIYQATQIHMQCILQLYPHKIAGCCPLDKYHLHLLIITFGVHKHTRARAESVYNISTPLLFRLLAGTWGGGCLIETSNCSVGSSLPIYLCTQCRAEIITQHLRYSGSLVSIFLPAACQHQRDHEKIRNLRAPMRDLGMIKRLAITRCCYRDKLISSVSMAVVPLYVQQKIFLYRVAGNRALQGIRGVGVVIGNSS